ncbi:MAG: hypothetical protein AAF483_28485 [Planctomycetota bacterium]
MNDSDDGRNSLKPAWYARREVALCAALGVLLASVVFIPMAGAGLLQTTVIGAVLTIACFALMRFIQLRGKLTLGVVAILLPALVALGCVAFSRMTPFLNRQIVADQMRDRGIRFLARQPSEFEEWLRDDQGYLLPTWIANLIGADCMTNLRSITADAKELDRISLDRVDTAKLWRVEVKVNEANTLSERVVDWLGGIQFEDDYSYPIQFTFHDFGPEDAASLRKLRGRWWAVIQVNSEDISFRNIGSPAHLRIGASAITNTQAEELAELVAGHEVQFLSLAVARLTPKQISFFGSSGVANGLMFEGTQIEVEHARALDALQMDSMTLVDVPLGDLSALSELPGDGHATELQIRNAYGELKDCCHLVRFLEAKHFSVSLVSNRPVTEKECEELFRNCPELESIDTFATEWKQFERPDDL